MFFAKKYAVCLFFIRGKFALPVAIFKKMCYNIRYININLIFGKESI